MNTDLHDKIDSDKRASRFARRSYKIYLEHFKSRDLKPTQTMDEFMQNYTTD